MNDANMENIRPTSAAEPEGDAEEPLISDVVMGATKAADVSLQDAFAKFREQKKSERRLLKACRTPGNRSQEFKDQLREKFIAQAHQYLGVPYHEKYREEGTELAPLYLDCCGLVRRCVQDLKEDFGFLIGRWNQAYQMDTLPEVRSFEQLRPGDLIFYEGTFTSKRSKVQKHNNVHVEIFLGGETGEATIGARFQKGVVSVFPSYKFVSKSWDLISYHYRSIDTWLDGLCVSHCPEHPWISESGSLYAAAGRKSIFNDEQQGDEAAGDYSDGEDEDGEGGGDVGAEVCPAPVSEQAQESREAATAVSPVIELAADGGVPPPAAAPPPGKAGPVPKRSSTSPSRAAGPGSGKLPPRVRKSAEALSSKEQSSADSAAAGAATPVSKRAQARAAEKEKREMIDGKPLPKTYYVHKSNGWKLVCAALDRRGWQQLPFEYNMSTRFTLKWVERRSQIDYKAHVPGQLVNHIVNNDVFTTKLGLVNCLRDFFCRTFHLGSSPAPSPAAAPSSSTKGSGPSGKKQPLAASSSSSRISFDDMILTTGPRLPTPWLMETYQLDQAVDCAEVLKDDEEASLLDTPDSTHLWIYKPSAGNRGRGVQVVRGGRELQELVASYVDHYHPTLVNTDTFKAVAHLVNQPPEPVAAGAKVAADEGSPSLASEDDGACFGKVPRAIIQRYCINPLLVEGYKFDIRCYMLVARTDPGYLAFYHPGYCRFTLLPYSYDPAHATDSFIHLTNCAVQKKHPSYQERKENQVKTVANVADLLEAAGDVQSAEYLRMQMNEDMMACMVDVLKAAKVKLHRKSGYFDLFGFDFMLRDRNRPSGLPPAAPGKGRIALRNDPSRQLLLIETNTNPAMHTDNEVLTSLLPRVIDGALELVLAANLPADKSGECGGVKHRTQYQTDLPSQFRLIYDEESGFEFGKPDRPAAAESPTPAAPDAAPGRSASPSKKAATPPC